MAKQSTAAAVPATVIKEVPMTAVAKSSSQSSLKSVAKVATAAKPAARRSKAAAADKPKRVAVAARRQAAIPVEAKTTAAKTTARKAKAAEAVVVDATAAEVVAAEPVVNKAKSGKAKSVAAKSGKAKSGKVMSGVAAAFGHEVSHAALGAAMPASMPEPAEHVEPEAVDTAADDAAPAAKRPVEKAKTAVGRLGRPKPETAEPTDPWADLIVRPDMVEGPKTGQLRMVAYLRYSSEMQTPNSLQRQLEVLRAYAAANNMIIVAVYSDVAISGLKEDRPGLEGAVKKIEDGEADGLLSEDCDRIARKLSILPAIFERIDAVNGQLWTMTRGRIASGIMATLFGIIAAEDHKKLVARFTAGVQIAVRQGRIPRLPFGYRRIESCVWEIDPQTSEVVRLIFDMYVGDGVSIHNIAKHLNGEGIAGPTGASWSDVQIGDTLRNPIYAGVYLHGRLRKSRRLPKSTTMYKAPHLALVSVETFAFAQAQLRDRAPDTTRVHYTHNFLKGRVFCADTGRSYHTVRCYGIEQLGVASPEGHAHGNKVHLSTLRSAVIDAIERRILNVEGDAAFDADRQAQRAHERKEIAGARISLSLKLKAANAKADEAADENFLAGASHERRKRRREELEEKVVELQNALIDLRRRERALDDALAVRETLKDRIDRLRAEGVRPDGGKASFELAQGLRAVVAAVRLRLDHANGLLDVAVDLAPNGDADVRRKRRRADADEPPAPIAIVTDEARIYMRRGRTEGDPFVSRAAAALARGWLTISEDDDRRLLERVEALKALPRCWSAATRISLVRGMLACSLTSLPLRFLNALQPSERHLRLSGGYHLFAKAGGVEQLRQALVELQLPGAPWRADQPLLPCTRPIPVVTWSDDWG